MKASPASTAPLIDGFGRRVEYLRVSVTDRCDLRCVYCMSEQMVFAPRTEVLSFEEIAVVCDAFVRRGVNRLRLTGGEPLVRRGIDQLAATLGRHLVAGTLRELTLTTNGTNLAAHAAALAAAGVRRVNVSLDTLDPDKFRAITRWGDLSKVHAGLAAARAAGIATKINMVALLGVNDGEIDAMLAFCATGGHDLTLIETMPMGEVEGDRVDRYLPLADVRSDLARRWTLVDMATRTGGPARYVRVAETGQTLGFITPLTHNFCESCNRVRLTATGQLYLCLGQDACVDLRRVVRRFAPGDPALDLALDAALDHAMAIKPRGHDFAIARTGVGGKVARHMSITGG